MKARKAALIMTVLSLPLCSGIVRFWRASVNRRAVEVAQELAYFRYLEGRAEGAALYAKGEHDARSASAGE